MPFLYIVLLLISKNKKEKSLTISLTQQRTPPIPTLHFNQSEEWGHEKNRSPTPKARKSKERKKEEESLKVSKLIKLNQIKYYQITINLIQ